MEGTTLVTFMLQHATARKVELLGSWDNFSQPYGMERDKRRGRGVWSGCHTVRDIICDGDEQGIHEARTEGLKMGGTYWYFYRVDDDEEFYDPDQETTTACPLMPGQTLNVVDVPSDVGTFGGHSRSASMVSLLNIVKTLNPEDRYVNPKPAPKPVPVAHAEAITTLRHLPDAPASTDAEHQPRPASRKRPLSAFLEDASLKQDHSRGCAQRPFKSAPASPNRARARRHYETTHQLQQASSEEILAQDPSGGDHDWPVRGTSLGLSSTEMVQDDYAINDQWPLMGPPQPRYAPPAIPSFDVDDAIASYYEDEFYDNPVSPHAFNMERDSLFASMPKIDFVAPSMLTMNDRDDPTPPPSLLPPLPNFTTSIDDMQKGLQVLDVQYTIDRHHSPWRSNTHIPLPESPETLEEIGSNAPSAIFSSVHGGDISDTTTSHRLSELRDWPMKSPSHQHQNNAFNDFHFDFDTAELALEPQHEIYSSFEHMSIHTTDTADTQDTVQPLPLVHMDPEDVAAIKAAFLPATDERSQMEQLLDEFEYLGAALT